MKNSTPLKITYVTLLTLAGTLFAQDEEEFIFTSLIAEKETAEPSLNRPASTGEEEVFTSLVVQPSASSDLSAEPVEIPAKPVKAPLETPALKPEKRLRDPFWPVGYIPKAWKTKTVSVDQDALASLNDQWVAASKKIKVSFTKMMNGQRVASINRKIKKPGDTIDVQHAGKTFQFKLGTVYANGKLGLKKGRVY